MMKKFDISPSLLNVPANQHKEKIAECILLGCNYIHFDVMDGKFVHNFNCPVTQFAQDAKDISAIKDVHLMVSEPLKFVIEFLSFGADIITVHYEAVKSESDLKYIARLIHEKGKKFGISIKPNTDVKVLNNILPFVDLVLVMSVEPGKGGQTFMKSALKRISYLHKFRKLHYLKYLIEVDGGINDYTGQLCVKKGCDVLVAGSYIFNGDVQENISKLNTPHCPFLLWIYKRFRIKA